MTHANVGRSLYRGYLLSSQPMALEDGRCQARVGITSLAGDKTRSQRFLDLGTFDAEADAIECGLQAGMGWVDSHDPPR